MKHHALRLVVLLSVFLGGCQSMPQAVLPDAPHDEIMLSAILPPPPVPGSVADRTDMAAVWQAQRTRTKTQILIAQQDAELSVFRFRPVFGARFTPDNLPVTAAFFARVAQRSDQAVHIAKDHYARPRPFVIDAGIKPVVPALPSFAYPSGHATFAYLSALLLAQAVPEKQRELYARATDYAYNRVVAGVHYPTDIVAGQIAASVIAQEMLHDPEMAAGLQNMHEELRRVLKI